MNKVCTKIQQNMSVVGNIGKIFGIYLEPSFFIIGLTPYADLFRPFRA